jgi:hypothetical protein
VKIFKVKFTSLDATVFSSLKLFREISSYVANYDLQLLYAVFVTTNRSSYVKATEVNFGVSYMNRYRKCFDRSEGEAHISNILKVCSTPLEDIRQANDVYELVKCVERRKMRYIQLPLAIKWLSISNVRACESLQLFS